MHQYAYLIIVCVGAVAAVWLGLTVDHLKHHRPHKTTKA